jgi:nickel transport system substrate-binding protein
MRHNAFILVWWCLAQFQIYINGESTLVVAPSTQKGWFETGDDVGAMNPHAYRPNEFVSNEWVFEGLTAWDPKTSASEDPGVIGALAESWTKTVDPTSGVYRLRFNLRRGVLFHDGAEWDSNAASLNFEHIMGGKELKFQGFHDWHGLPGALKSWSAVDKFTFELEFTKFYEPALRELSFIRPFRMLSPRQMPDLKAGELSCAAWRQGIPRTPGNIFTCRGIKSPIGTGPYMVVKKILKSGKTVLPSSFNETCYFSTGCKYSPGDYVTEVHFKKNTNHRSSPVYDNLIMRAYASTLEIKSALLAGDLDVAYGPNVLSPSQYVSIAASSGKEKVTAFLSDTNLNTRLIALNSAGALNTTALRKTILKSINRMPLLEAELAEEQPRDTIFDPALPYCNIPLTPINDLVAVGAAPVTAIVAPLRLAYLKDVALQNTIVSHVVANLYQAGIQTTLLPMEKDDYNAVMDSGAFDLAYTETWGPPYDPTSKMYDWTYEGSGEADYFAQKNLIAPTQAEIRGMVLAAQFEVKSDVRQDLYSRAIRGVQDQAVYLPISSKRNIAVVNDRVSGFKFGFTEFDIPVAAMRPATPPGLPAGTLAGIIVGSVVGASMCSFLAFMIYRECRGAPIFPLDKEMQPLVSSRPSSDLVRTNDPQTPYQT